MMNIFTAFEQHYKTFARFRLTDWVTKHNTFTVKPVLRRKRHDQPPEDRADCDDKVDGAVSMVTWTCVQAGHRRCRPMGDGTDPVSVASGPDSDLRRRRLFKPKCFMVQNQQRLSKTTVNVIIYYIYYAII